MDKKTSFLLNLWNNKDLIWLIYHKNQKLWYFVFREKILTKLLKGCKVDFYQMAEAGIAAYGSAIGVAIALAVVCFALRGKGHPEPQD